MTKAQTTSREHILEDEYARAEIHRTDNVWFMYLTDWSQHNEQYTFSTLKDAKAVFASHAARLRRKNDPMLNGRRLQND